MLTTKISNKLAEKLGYNQDESEVIAYGLFAVLQISASLILVAFFGLVFGIIRQALAFSFAASILRQFSGGAHASKPSICLVVGTVATIGFAYLSHVLSPVIDVKIIIVMEIIIIIYSYFIIYKKAPVDSPAKPIKTEKKKSRMKKISLSVLSTYLLFIILFTVFYYLLKKTIYIEFSTCICFAILWQVFNLTVIGHKLLGKIDSFIGEITIFKKGDSKHEKS